MQTFEEIMEAEFDKMKAWYDSTRTKKAQTGIQTVLTFLMEHPEKVWWWSWEFVGKTTRSGGYLSHRAPARASDLAIHYPDFVEDRRIGRFSVYRLKFENIAAIKSFLNIHE